MLAQQALAGNDLRTAREAIAAAIEDRDDVVEYHLLRGRIELAAGSPGAAFNAYNDALGLDATNGEALLNVAQLGLSTGHLRDSLEATEHVLTLAPDNIDALLLRGIHAIIKRNYPEAIEFGDRILALSPGHEGGTILKSRALFMSAQPEEALAVLEEISGSAVDSVAAALTRLEIYRALRQAEKLGPEFVHLRKLRPDDTVLRTDEANFRFKTGERKLAHELVAQIIDEDVLGPDPHQLGLVSRRLEFLALTEVGGEGHDLAVVCLPQPFEDDAGVEAAGKGEHDTAELVTHRGSIAPISRLRAHASRLAAIQARYRKGGLPTREV